MITTCDKELASKMRLLHGQGMNPLRRYWFPMVGNNFRMTNIQATLGLAQLEKIDYHLEKRRDVASWYDRHLGSLEDVLELPTEEPWARHSYWIYTILLKNGLPSHRDELMRELAMTGIETRPVFYPMHVIPHCLEHSGSYPVAESCSGRGILLPTRELVEEGVAYIAGILSKSCLRSRTQAAR